MKLHSPNTTLFPNIPNRTASLNRNSTPYSNGGGGQNRTNSLRTYSYHPGASYVAGQPLQKSTPAPPSPRVIPRRYNSLTNATKRLNSLSSQNSNLRRHSIDELGPELIGEDEEVTITTQTTEVVDALGRTQSITTRTIKQLPDGSNIIETTTKSVSRGGSRTSSLRADSLMGGRQNANTNLTIIDEDLQDFDYNYQLDNPKLAAAVPLVLNHNHQEPPTNSLSNPISSPPILSPKLVPPPPILKDSPQQQQIIERSSSLVLNGSNKPLKLIMKHRLQDAESEPDYADARDSFAPSTSPGAINKEEFSPPPPPAVIQHPYKSLSNSPTSPLLPSKKVAAVQDSQARNNHWGSSHETASQLSGSNSIKFNEVVETIAYTPDAAERENDYFNSAQHQPPPAHNNKVQHEKRKQLTDDEMYLVAIEAAKRKVYGDRAADELVLLPSNGPHFKTSLRSPPPLKSPTSPQSPRSGYNAVISTSSPTAISATSPAFASTSEPIADDVTLSSSTHKAMPKKSKANQGVPKDYQYKSHNKPLSAHTLRGSENIVEQKVVAKQQEKEKKEVEKNERNLQKKQQKDDAKKQKLAAKELARQKKLEAKALKKPHKGFLFFRKSSMDSSSEQSNHRVSTDTNTTSALGDTTFESSMKSHDTSIPITSPPQKGPVYAAETNGEHTSDISRSVFAVIDNYNSESIPTIKEESKSTSDRNKVNSLDVDKNEGLGLGLPYEFQKTNTIHQASAESNEKHGEQDVSKKTGQEINTIQNDELATDADHKQVPKEIELHLKDVDTEMEHADVDTKVNGSQKSSNSSAPYEVGMQELSDEVEAPGTYKEDIETGSLHSIEVDHERDDRGKDDHEVLSSESIKNIANTTPDNSVLDGKPGSKKNTNLLSTAIASTKTESSPDKHEDHGINEDIAPSTKTITNVSMSEEATDDLPSNVNGENSASSDVYRDLQEEPVDTPVMSDVVNESYGSVTPDISQNIRESGHFIELIDFDESQPEDNNEEDDRTIEQGVDVKTKEHEKTVLEPPNHGISTLENQKQAPKKKGKFRMHVLKYFVNGYDK